MSRTADGCPLHPTPQPSICFTCNQINRDEWGTPEPTEQDAADAFYDSIYGEPQPPELPAEDDDLYTQLFPK